MSRVDIAAIRQEYMRESLDERDVAGDPFVQFGRWFDEAVRAELPMVNAMTLATVSSGLQPSARIVLLKGVDRGLVFYTHYDSSKGQELAENPRAALLFYWTELEREVRIEGTVEKTSSAESDEYFATRPLGSRLAANASHQSRVVADRQALEAQFLEVQRRYGENPPRPAEWGGYRVLPRSFEFWQGRANRLHDRLRYTRAANGTWKITRLAP